MTIIAGFRCSEGVVICSDTQETVTNIAKRSVTKVKMFPAGGYAESSDFGMAICGSGDGPFVDLMTRKIWQSAETASSIAEAADNIELRIKNLYREYSTIYQPGERPTVELIYGIKMNGETLLFHAYGPTVNEVDEYKSAGYGCYMADFLQSRMGRNLLTVNECAILAAYILFQTKEHVDGCGGDSHIAVLGNDGRNGFVDGCRINSWNELLEGVDRQLGHILLTCAKLKDDLNAEESFRSAISTIDWLRKSHPRRTKGRPPHHGRDR